MEKKLEFFKKLATDDVIEAIQKETVAVITGSRDADYVQTLTNMKLESLRDRLNRLKTLIASS